MCCPAGSVGYLASDHKDAGRKVNVGGVDVYESGTQGESVVLVLPDVFGWDSGRLRAITDTLSKEHGFFFAVPKVLSPFEGGTDGDGLPPVFDLGTRKPELLKCIGDEWNPAKVVPLLEAVLKGYAEKGVKKAVLYGFCLGGWLGFHLSSRDTAVPIVAGATPHPSLVAEGLIGGDPVSLGDTTKCPWLLHPAGKADDGGDSKYYDKDGDLFKKLEERFAGQNETFRFEGESHGFVTRGSITNGTACGSGEATDAAIKKSLDLTVAFFKKHGL